MGKDYLSELVTIWERWTNCDPLLREAVQGYGVLSIRPADLLDRVLDHLIALTNLDGADAATVAALSAGWAVLLALNHDQHAQSPSWQHLYHDALHSHREALAVLQYTAHTPRGRRSQTG